MFTYFDVYLDCQRRYWTALSEFWRVPSTPAWHTQNRIVLELDGVLLRDFGGEGKPLLILPPQAGHHSSIADYGPGQSLVEAALKEGFHVYATEWRCADYARRNENIDDFINYTDKVVEHILFGNAYDLALVGLCQGGWQASIFTALYPFKVNHLVLAGAPIDFAAGNGLIKQYADMTPMAFYEWLVMMGGGLLSGKMMLAGFKGMNWYDRFVNDFLDIYENVDDEKFMERTRRFRNWYEFTQDLPGAFYLQVVSELFKSNKLIKGTLRILNRKVDLLEITCPVTLIGGEADDITIPCQCLNAAGYLGSKDVEQLLFPGGHIGLFVSTRSVQKYWPCVFDRIQVAAWGRLGTQLTLRSRGRPTRDEN